MTVGPRAACLPGDRLHLQHGPIDLVIGVDGPARAACFTRAQRRFRMLLTELVEELSDLRKPVTEDTVLNGPVANRMLRAVRPFAESVVTPMAAVAGAVADEVLAAMIDGNPVRKVYVNNGGDIACHLESGACLRSVGPAGTIELTAERSARGLATSGWQGRSHSLGIADAVTVAARTAAEADVAATLIANAVDLPGHPAIARVPASELSPDSDLVDRLVTIDVDALSPAEIDRALAAGLDAARSMQARGLIAQAVLCLQGESVATTTKGTLAHA